ncbi:MAG: hypothetical protein H6811_06590 [Phycisphaeraceae bacterium]|nr:hypothetical protein [Phycisphaeraceae bacterium]
MPQDPSRQTDATGAPPPGADRPRPAQGDVMDLIADVEAQLASLKKAHEIRQREMTQLREHREQLSQRERALRQIAVGLDQRTSTLDERTAELDRRDEVLRERLRQLEAEQAQLERRTESVASREKAAQDERSRA